MHTYSSMHGYIGPHHTDAWRNTQKCKQGAEQSLLMHMYMHMDRDTHMHARTRNTTVFDVFEVQIIVM